MSDDDDDSPRMLKKAYHNILGVPQSIGLKLRVLKIQVYRTCCAICQRKIEKAGNQDHANPETHIVLYSKAMPQCKDDFSTKDGLEQSREMLAAPRLWATVWEAVSS